MKSLYLGASMLAMAAAAIVPASAADMYRGEMGGYKDGPVYAPVATWTGFYAGVNGGYAFDARKEHGGLQDEGGFGGGQIGYNWQGILHPHLVFGVEADIQGTGIDNKGVTTIFDGVPANHEISVDYFGTVRGRIGYATGPLLVYGTGGFAYGNVNNQFHVVANNNVFSSDSVQTGFAAGGGVEYKFSPAWSLKAEYQYIDLGHSDPVLTAGSVQRPGVPKTGDVQLNTVRVGLNYHFGQGYEPLK